MNHENTVDAEARLDALLKAQPIAADEEFSRRVFDAIADAEIDARLAEMPVEGSEDFSERVMRAVAADAVPANAVAFPRSRAAVVRFVRCASAGLAAALVVVFGLSLFSEKDLSVRVAGVLDSDPELAQLASAADDDPFSFDELVAASRMLAVLNENSAETAEFFAYYEN